MARKQRVLPIKGRNRGRSIPTVIAEPCGYLIGRKEYFRLPLLNEASLLVRPLFALLRARGTMIIRCPMILETTGHGPLGAAVRDAIRGTEEGVRSARGDAPDLFMTALGCRAIVSATGDSLLDGRLEPAPSPERMRSVVSAANAPGVKLLVVVVPPGGRYDDEELVVRKDGVPYVILRCPPLIEELADAANFHITGSVWLARGKTMAVSTRANLSAAVARALTDDSLQGATIEVASTQVDMAEAVRRAARVAGARTEVRTAPFAASAYRTLVRWLRVPQPPVLALYERMAAVAA